MYRVVLNKEEKKILGLYFLKSPIRLIRLKAQTILMADEQLTRDQMARLVVRRKRTIQLWIKQFVKYRFSSLFSGHSYNENASKLTRIQKLQIKQILSQPPDEYGIPKEFWDVPKLKEYVKAEFDVVYESDISYHYLLKFSGLSFKYPDKLSPRRDERFIKTRTKQIRKEIKPLLKNQDWIVLAADETRVQLEAEIRKAWLVKGKRTVVKTERSKDHQNYLGFLDQKTGNCEVYEIEKGKEIYVIPVLEQLIKKHPTKKVCVIWDNASFHKGKLLREKLKKNNSLERLHLINFPPYAPDHNPIEHVWNFAKNKIKNRSNLPFDIIKQTFLKTINSQAFNYRI